MWVFYCDGLQGYQAEDSYQPNQDEVSFDHEPTEEELKAAFPNYLTAKADRNNQLATLNRAAAYKEESDPIFFKWQRGEATEQEWLDKVAEIKARYPKV